MGIQRYKAGIDRNDWEGGSITLLKDENGPAVLYADHEATVRALSDALFGILRALTVTRESDEAEAEAIEQALEQARAALAGLQKGEQGCS